MSYKNINNLLDEISNTNQDNTVSLYFGDFTKLNKTGINTTLGSDNKENFLNCIRYIQGILKQKYENKNIRIYQHRDMFMSIDNQNNYVYTLEKHLKTLVCDNVCANVKYIKSISKENFPILDKYSSISNYKIKTITGDSCIVHFIDHTNDKLSVRVDFTNKNSKSIEECRLIVNKIILSIL